MIELVEFLLAERQIRPFLDHSPLIHSPYLSDLTGGDIWLKLENLLPTGSFKVRGALNKINCLTAADRELGIVAASAGNHALGVAFAVSALGLPKADLFVPETAPAAKINKLRRFPINIHRGGETYEDAHQAALAFQKQTGAVEIPAYDDLDVITGQGTIGVEIMTNLPASAAIILPVGGGGLIAGVATAVRQIKPACRIVGIQPAASPAARLSFAENRAIDPYDHAPTIADGLAGGFGAAPFELLRNDSPEILLTSEADIRRAVLTLLAEHQLVIEPSGATAIAPLLTGAIDLAGATAVCVLTGGNLAIELLREIVS